MAQFKSISKLQINNHVWHLTDPQAIAHTRDKDGQGFDAVLTIHREADLWTCDKCKTDNEDGVSVCGFCDTPRLSG